MYSVHKMWPFATDVAHSMVCLCVITRMYCAKMAESVEKPFWERLALVGPRNHVLNWGQDTDKFICSCKQ